MSLGLSEKGERGGRGLPFVLTMGDIKRRSKRKLPEDALPDGNSQGADWKIQFDRVLSA